MANLTTYRLTPSLNDGKNDAPPVEHEVYDVDELMAYIEDELTNDYGEAFGPGFTLLIERIA